MKKLLLSFSLVALSSSAFSQTAKVQAIHNSADMAAATVDVWLTTPSGSALLIDDFQFRTASPFIDAPAGVPISLSIAPSTSATINDTIPGLTFNYNLTANEIYVLVAEGIVSPTGYSPATPFGISVFGQGQLTATTSTNTDVLVHHGATDAPTVDVDEVTAGNLVDDASYGDFAGYLNLPTNDYTLEVKDATGSVTVASYSAPLSTLQLDGQAIVVLASGFLDPSNNSNGPAFGLYVALAAGGALVELPSATASIDNLNNEKINVFPNPSSEYITITGLKSSNSNLKVINQLGKTLLNVTDLDNNQKINISNLPEGIYHISISNADGIFTTEKLIKK